MREDPKILLLDTFDVEERGTIVSIEAEESLYHRLAALGLRPGKKLRLLRRAPFGGPLQIRVGMTEVMLRPREARCVRVTREDRP